MGRKSQSRVLRVAMNGHEVGQLTCLSRGHLRFEYEASWIAKPGAMPISLSMPLSLDPYAGGTVWNFFDNLLPDNDGIRERLQRVLGAESKRPFDLLEQMGRDCVGALQLYEDSEKAPDVRKIEARAVDDAWIAARLRDCGTRPLGMSGQGGFRISIAGAQEKTALLWHEGKWHEPLGATPTTHILKLPIGEAAGRIDLSDSVENEWLCLQIVKAFGLPVAKAEVQAFEDCKALVVERFDRRWARDRSWLIRLSQEDVCQALGVSAAMKYESEGGPGIAATLDFLNQTQDPAHDRSTFFRAVIVYWLLAAIDGHAKNFSVFLLPRGGCNLTPLYDIISAYPIVARKQLRSKDLMMAMAVDGKNRHYHWSEIQRGHWSSTAKKGRFPQDEAESILNDLATRGPQIVNEVSRDLPADFPQAIADAILGGVEKALKQLQT